MHAPVNVLPNTEHTLAHRHHWAACNCIIYLLMKKRIPSANAQWSAYWNMKLVMLDALLLAHRVRETCLNRKMIRMGITAIFLHQTRNSKRSIRVRARKEKKRIKTVSKYLNVFWESASEGGPGTVMEYRSCVSNEVVYVFRKRVCSINVCSWSGIGGNNKV